MCHFEYLQPRRPGRAWVTYLGLTLKRTRTVLVDDAECEVPVRYWLCRCAVVLVIPADERGFGHYCPVCEFGR
jgi:hypothetical protein